MSPRKREFFEAFHSEDARKNDSAPLPSRPRPAAPRKPAAVAPKDARFYTIARDKAVGMGFALAVLLIIAFFFGYLAGRPGAEDARVPVVNGDDTSPDTARANGDGTRHTPTDPVDSGRTPPDTTASQIPRVIYRLQIVGGIPRANAEQLVAFLGQQGYSPVVTQQGTRYTVFVGEFASPNSPEARAFRDRFIAMEYQGSRQFASALFIRFERED